MRACSSSAASRSMVRASSGGTSSRAARSVSRKQRRSGASSALPRFPASVNSYRFPTTRLASPTTRNTLLLRKERHLLPVGSWFARHAPERALACAAETMRMKKGFYSAAKVQKPVPLPEVETKVVVESARRAWRDRYKHHEKAF